MAKKRNRVTTGMSIKDIIQITPDQLRGYKPSEQREILSRLASAANKRLSRLEKKGIETFATTELRLSGGKLSAQQNTEGDILREFYRAKKFLNARTSTVKGIKEEKKRVEKIQEKFQTENAETITKAFALYDYLAKNNPTLIGANTNYQKTINDISEIIENSPDLETALRNTVRDLEEKYRREQDSYLQSRESVNPIDRTPARHKRRTNRRRKGR